MKLRIGFDLKWSKKKKKKIGGTWYLLGCTFAHGVSYFKEEYFENLNNYIVNEKCSKTRNHG